MRCVATAAKARKCADDLRQQIPVLLDACGITGMSIVLLRDGLPWWHQVFGLANKATEEPLKKTTIFEAASFTKPVMATAAMQLVEQGMLQLDVPLLSYDSEGCLKDIPQAETITLRHVLSHSSGLPNWRRKNKPLRGDWQSGTRFTYSGEGYEYLRRVLEQHLTDLPASIRQSLLIPLGMKHTTLLWPEKAPATKAAGHDKAQVPQALRYWPQLNAAASLHSTAADFARFMSCFLVADHRHPACLSNWITATMLTPQIIANDLPSWDDEWPDGRMQLCDDVQWGLGWGLQTTDDGPSFWQWGDNSWYQHFAAGWPESGTGIVVMTNSVKGQQGIFRLLRDILQQNLPAYRWLHRINAL